MAALILGILLLVQAAAAVLLYVSSAGNSPNCAQLQPCTVQQALNIANPGDVVFLASGTYYGNFVLNKTGVTVTGYGESTIVVSAGAFNAQNQEVVFDISAPYVTLASLRAVHPTVNTSAQDIGVYVRGPNAQVVSVHVERLRSMEPTSPGSRGVLIYQATPALISSCYIIGPYQDLVSVLSNGAIVTGSYIGGATRLGVSIVQEVALVSGIGTTNDSYNAFINNVINGAAYDCVEIEGSSFNLIYNNQITNCGRDAIRLCGPNSSQCFMSANALNAISSFNLVNNNSIGAGIGNSPFSNFGGSTNVYIAGPASVVQFIPPPAAPTFPSHTTRAAVPNWILVFALSFLLHYLNSN